MMLGSEARGAGYLRRVGAGGAPEAVPPVGRAPRPSSAPTSACHPPRPRLQPQPVWACALPSGLLAQGATAFELGWSRGPGAKSGRVIGTSGCFSREAAGKLPCGHSRGLGLSSVALGVIQIITVESFRKQFCSALAPLLASLPPFLSEV